jgi:hypothetical protein
MVSLSSCGAMTRADALMSDPLLPPSWLNHTFNSLIDVLTVSRQCHGRRFLAVFSHPITLYAPAATPPSSDSLACDTLRLCRHPLCPLCFTWHDKHDWLDSLLDTSAFDLPSNISRDRLLGVSCLRLLLLASTTSFRSMHCARGRPSSTWFCLLFANTGFDA